MKEKSTKLKRILNNIYVTMKIAIHFVLWEKNMKNKKKQRAVLKFKKEFEEEQRRELEGGRRSKILAKNRE